MLDRFGRLIFRWRWTVLAVGLLFLLSGGLYGGGVFSSLKNGGFEDKGSQSYRTLLQLQNTLHTGSGDVVVLLHSDSLTVDDPAFAAAGRAVLDRLNGQPNIEQVASFASTGSAAFVSRDRHSTYAVVAMTGGDDVKQQRYDQLRPLLNSPLLRVQFGGAVPVNEAVSKQVSKDLGRAESLTFPITALLLLLIFGGLVAAALPLVIGGLAILGAFTMLRLLTNVTDVSVFSLNVVTALGLGLAIDYSLFMVSRFREELPGRTVEQALARTLATAGRTVALSGLTVALSLCALLIFPQMFLRSMGFGGVAAVLVAMLASLTVLPALLAVLGGRVNALSLPRLLPGGRQAASGDPAYTGFWYRIAHAVMRRPAVIAAGIVIVLLVLGAPFLRATFSLPDARVLPAGAEARVVSETLTRDFPQDETSPLRILVRTDGPALAAANVAALYDYSVSLRDLPHVRSVESLTTLVPGVDAAGYAALYSNPTPDPRLAAAISSFSEGNLTLINVYADAGPTSSAAQRLVTSVRHQQAPGGLHVQMGGESAALVDQLQSLRSHIPVGLALIVVTVFVLLFLAFGSVVVPLKAVLLNFLSLSASFGALVWIFQDGHLQHLLGFQSLGYLDATQPVLIFAIAFGLSMDYEVFLLSRIKEVYDRTGNNTTAVATGLQHTGRIITSAALLLTVVLGAFASSQIIFIKEIGVGMALAIFMDATVVRSLLVPATMRLMGHLNWWAPAPLKRLWERAGLGEVENAPRPAMPGRPGGEPAPAGSR